MAAVSKTSAMTRWCRGSELPGRKLSCTSAEGRTLRLVSGRVGCWKPSGGASVGERRRADGAAMFRVANAPPQALPVNGGVPERFRAVREF